MLVVAFANADAGGAALPTLFSPPIPHLPHLSPPFSPFPHSSSSLPPLSPPPPNHPPLDAANVVLAHVPVVRYDFSAKSQFLAMMLRRMVIALLDPRELDDMDYYGNKRLELAGQLLALLFEDLFKRLNVELRKQAEIQLSKAAKGTNFDVAKFIRPDIITYGLESAISSGERTRITLASVVFSGERTRIALASVVSSGERTRIALESVVS